MRLKLSDQEKIYKTVESFVGDSSFRLFLFGSRVDDNALGGDIDLLLLFADRKLKEDRLKKGALIVQIQKAIGERRIDIVMDQDPPESEFGKSALESAEELCPRASLGK